MPKFRIRHITKYVYEGPVRDSANQIMLYPVKDDFQEVFQHELAVSGGVPIATHIDYFGNEQGTFTHAHPHEDLLIDSRLVVVTRPRPMPVDNEEVDQSWAELSQIRSQFHFLDYLRYDWFEGMDEVAKVADAQKAQRLSPLASAKALCSYVFEYFSYQKGITTVESTLAEVWQLKSGVCQDFAQILLVLLRRMDLPARYVSGYICPNKNGMRGEGATHAWVEAYIPFYGWLGLDPTNNCVVNDNHVRLAVGRHFADCSPVKGTYRGSFDHTLTVTVSVSYEDGGLVESSPVLMAHEPMTSFSKNSYRRHQEMQMQQ